MYTERKVVFVFVRMMVFDVVVVFDVAIVGDQWYEGASEGSG